MGVAGTSDLRLLEEKQRMDVNAKSRAEQESYTREHRQRERGI